MLVLKKATLAFVDELFGYKSQSIQIPAFPGITNDQWGIKAHNRSWVLEAGDWKKGQRVIEVGGAYSRLPELLSETFGVEAWVGDDFGRSEEDSIWSRWGDPLELVDMNPTIRYVFEKFGNFSNAYPDGHFDRIFTVSTLEHVPLTSRLDVLRDMNRCTAKGGRQLHAIDIPIPAVTRVLVAGCAERLGLRTLVGKRFPNGIAGWINTFKASGIRIHCPQPNTASILDRRVLVESPDIVYRYYPPNDAPKPYKPGASLLLVIEDI